MAAHARGGGLIVVERQDGRPQERFFGMAGFTGVTGLHVHSMFADLTARTQVNTGNTSVAVHTQINEAAVVGVDQTPVNHAQMTRIACRRGRDMIRRLAFLGETTAAVVADCTGCRRLNLSMVEGARRRPL